MYLYYDGYWFDNNEVAVTITKRPFYNQRGYRQYTRETWTVTGIKQASGQAGLTTALATLQTALSNNGGDIGIYLDDQATLTTHYMVSANTIGGTRVIDYSFPKGDGAEYNNGSSTFRTYSFAIEADFPDSAGFLLDFQETLTFQGNGGPNVVYLPVLTGFPQAQMTTQRTTYKAIQSGRATGYGFWPTPPGPIWPQAEIGPLREAGPISPSIMGGNPNEFTVFWKYSFESAQALSGYPNSF